MSHNFFVWFMRFLAWISSASFVVIVFVLPPYVDNNNFEELIFLNIISFFLIFFLVFFSWAALILFRVRKLKSNKPKKDELDNMAGASFRQGFLLALMALALLVMQSFNILLWWDGLLVVGVAIMLELYFLLK